MRRLAELMTRFGQNVLADESAFKLVLRNEADLAGLPEFVRAAARQPPTPAPETPYRRCQRPPIRRRRRVRHHPWCQ